MADSIGNLQVVIGARTDEFVKSLENAQKDLKKFNKKFSDGLKVVGGAIAGVGASIVATGIASVKTYAEMGDAVDKMSKRTGLAAETVSELRYAAELSGTSLEAVEKATKTMGNTMLDAQNGLATAVRAFDQLGISLEDLQSLSPEERLITLMEAVADIEDPSIRSAAAMDVFGKSGTELLPMLSDGAAGLEAMRQEARDLGIVFDEESAGKAADFADTMTKLEGSLNGLKMAIAEAIVPVLKQLIDHIMPIIQKFKDFAAEHPALVGWVFKLGAVLAVVGAAMVTVGMAVGPVSKSMTLLISVVKNLGKAWDKLNVSTIKSTASLVAHKVALVASRVASLAAATAQWVLNAAMAANPIGLVVAAIAALIAIVVTMTGKWGEVVDFFKGIWDKVYGFFKDNIDWILAILVPFIGIPKLIIENWDKIASFFSDLWDGIVNVFSTAWDTMYGIGKKIVDGLWAGIKAIASWIANIATEVWNSITGAFADAWNGMYRIGRQIIDGLYGGISSLLSSVWNIARDVWNSIKNVFGDAWDIMYDIGREIVTGIWDGMVSLWGWLKDNVGGFFADILGFSAGEGGGWSWKNLMSPNPRDWFGFAKGGIITEPTAMIGLQSGARGIMGEAGPEAIVPMGQLNSAGGGTTISNSFNISQLVVREEADIQRIARELYRLQRSKERQLGVG